MLYKRNEIEAENPIKVFAPEPLPWPIFAVAKKANNSGGNRYGPGKGSCVVTWHKPRRVTVFRRNERFVTDARGARV